MSNRNHKRTPEKRRKGAWYGLGKGCLGLILLAVGVGMSLDISRLEEIPLWIPAGPDINIYQEGPPTGDLNVECLVEDGTIELKLFAGSRLKEETAVWVSVTDLFFPYQWKTYGMDEMLAAPIGTELYDVPEKFPQEKVLTAVKSQKQEGETQISWFLATVGPGKGGCRLHIEMDPENLTYEEKGNINIRMPQVSASRESEVYGMDSGDMADFLASKETDLGAIYASYYMNGKELMMPDIHISSIYKWDNDTESYRELDSIWPEPNEIDRNSITWEEEVQWLPAVAIHDASYEKGEVFQSLIGGIFITVGSGIVIAPALGWLKRGETLERRTAAGKKRR